jgi:hypothetical protein
VEQVEQLLYIYINNNNNNNKNNNLTKHLLAKPVPISKLTKVEQRGTSGTTWRQHR